MKPPKNVRQVENCFTCKSYDVDKEMYCIRDVNKGQPWNQIARKDDGGNICHAVCDLWEKGDMY